MATGMAVAAVFVDLVIFAITGILIGLTLFFVNPWLRRWPGTLGWVLPVAGLISLLLSKYSAGDNVTLVLWVFGIYSVPVGAVFVLRQRQITKSGSEDQSA